MDPLESLNETLRQHAPAAAASLSPMGRRLYLPRGIPAQAKDAANCRVNATIGQWVGADGHAAPPEALESGLRGLEKDSALLYSPQGGLEALRQAWANRMDARESGSFARTLPIVTAGITQGLSLLADLFIGEGTPVLVPEPCWENYHLLFGTRPGGKRVPYRALSPEGFPFVEFRRVLAQTPRPAVLVLNFPSNPGGYSLSQAETEEMTELLARDPGPLVVITDDAYQGMVWDTERPQASVFRRLSQRFDPTRALAVAVDGATKELFFFGGRVGFVTFGADGPGGKALEEKLTAAIRGTTSSPSGPAEAAVLRALANPELENQVAQIHAELRARCDALRAALIRHAVPFYPFNSAFFAMVPVPGDSEQVRRALLAKGVGTVAVPGALRLSYASVQLADIDLLAATVAEVLGTVAPQE